MKREVKAPQKQRFVEAAEQPLPNYVWIVDTNTGKALKVGLCDLPGVRQFISFIGNV